MLFSTSTHTLAQTFGLEKAVDIIMDAGFPAIDMTMFDLTNGAYDDGYRELAKKLLEKTKARGVVFNQAHAPFGGGIENYRDNLLPLFPRMFEFLSLIGAKRVVVHPFHGGKPHYGNEEEWFEINMEFYSSLIPMAQNSGVKIALENMWNRHPVSKLIIDDVCADPAELVRYYDALGRSDVFDICLDLGHVGVCQREPDIAIRTIGKKLGALHTHDVDYLNDLHTLPGVVGKYDWDLICRALADVGYNGEITLEADNFIRNMMRAYGNEFAPVASKFMADCTRRLVEKVEEYKKQVL